MSLYCCESKCKCALWSIVASVIIGVIAAFLQITGVITVTAAFLWVTFGIAVVYLGILAATVGMSPRAAGCCTPIGALLAGILGTVLFSVIQLAVGITATAVISAIFTGLLLFFFTLTIGGTACYIRCAVDCAA